MNNQNLSKNNIRLTNITIKIKENYKKLVGTADIIINNLIQINGLNIVKHKDNYFVSLPKWTDSYGYYHYIAFILDKEIQKQIEKEILHEYFEKLSEKKNNEWI